MDYAPTVQIMLSDQFMFFFNNVDIEVCIAKKGVRNG